MLDYSRLNIPIFSSKTLPEKERNALHSSVYLMTNKEVECIYEGMLDPARFGPSIMVVYKDGTKDIFDTPTNKFNNFEREKENLHNELKKHLPYMDRKLREIKEGI